MELAKTIIHLLNEPASLSKDPTLAVTCQFNTDDHITIQFDNGIQVTIDFEEQYCRIHRFWILQQGIDLCDDWHDVNQCANMIIQKLYKLN